MSICLTVLLVYMDTNLIYGWSLVVLSYGDIRNIRKYQKCVVKAQDILLYYHK